MGGNDWGKELGGFRDGGGYGLGCEWGSVEGGRLMEDGGKGVLKGWGVGKELWGGCIRGKRCWVLG